MAEKPDRSALFLPAYIPAKFPVVTWYFCQMSNAA